MIRRVIATLALAVASIACAQQQPPGVVEIQPPIATDSKDKIEVIEFFWYECQHCYALEPHLETWVKKLPKEVEFRRVPAMFNERWAISGRVYYALEAMGELERLHKPLFDAIHKQNLKITNEDQLTDWLQRQKVDVAKFRASLKSFGVESRLRRARDLTEAFVKAFSQARPSDSPGVPTLMVNGRYLVAAATSEEQMLGTAESLIERSRKPAASSAAPKK